LASVCGSWKSSAEPVASRARLESINRVALDRRPDEGLQPPAVGDIDPGGEQAREVLSNLDKSKRPTSAWRSNSIKISMSLTRLRSARDGAEQRCVAHPAPTQFGLVSEQHGHDLFSISAGARPGLTLKLTHRDLVLSSPAGLTR
jgi:hypothetical protein